MDGLIDRGVSECYRFSLYIKPMNNASLFNISLRPPPSVLGANQLMGRSNMVSLQSIDLPDYGIPFPSFRAAPAVLFPPSSLRFVLFAARLS